MIVKFHQKSERVKGLSFHPKRPWLLAGLHTGNIQLWDFRLGRVIDEFIEHDGAVRSVQFHPSLSLFVSGSDDLTIRVWNYKTKKCQFVLRGHLDFVRSVNFHPELPWCVSGSDDNTARIWNYQSRQMIAIITGHSHYVMQCQFHPTQDYMITCSLDQTIRLWSITQLKKKFTSRNQIQNENTTELELVQILEGHQQGVNWCSFHPTQNLIVSSSDDKKIKIWKYSETRCYEIESFNGHTNNVSCALFHPKCDVMISNSEDKTQRVWDLKKKVEVDCFTNKELDRFWILAAHQDNYYFAAGSDSALYICTLFKDRPPMDLINTQFLCIGYQKQIKVIDLRTQQEKLLRNLSDISSIQDNILQDNIEFLQHNVYDTNKTQILVRLKQSQHNKQKNISKFVVYEQQTNIVQMFLGKAAVFIGKSKVVRSKDNTELEIYNYETDQHTLLSFKADKLFPFLGGKVLFYYDQTLNIIDPISNTVLLQTSCTVEFNNIKKVIYNQQFIAVQTKRGIYIFTKQLQKVTSIQEKINIKSILFLSETQNILLYTTKVHLKYLLINGDSGILKTTENILYLVQIQQPIERSSIQFKIFFLDCQWQLQNFMIDCSEFLFKQALFDKNMKSIQEHLKNKKRGGDALIAYLYQKQYSMLAINLVDDKKAKFQLAISSSNLEMAYRSCEEIKDPKCYQQLLEEALRQGNHNIVEICEQKLKQYDSLTMLYITTGQLDKLNVLADIAKEQKNSNTRFQTHMCLGKIQQIQEQLNDCKLLSLANLSQMVHGFAHNTSLNCAEDLEWIQSQQTEALIPPVPLIKSTKNPLYSINWPHNYVGEDEILRLSGDDNSIQQNINKEEINIKPDIVQQEEKNDQIDEEEFQDCQWGLDEEELLEPQRKAEPLTKSTIDNISFKHGYPDYKKVLSPGEQIMTEKYEQCFQQLKKQINLNTSKPFTDQLKSLALQSIMEVSQIPFLSAAPLIVQEIQDKIYIQDETKNLLKLGYKYTTEGKFQESLKSFREILKQALFIRNKEIVPICLNYILAMKCELAKKGSDVQRQIELACYMAMCDLQPAHRSLTLRAAMSLSYKHKNFITGSQISRYLIKLLQNAPQGAQYSKPETIENVKKMQKNCDQFGSNEYKINFDESYLDIGINHLCADTLTIQSKVEKCQYDGGAHSKKQQLCSICEMCAIG